MIICRDKGIINHHHAFPPRRKRRIFSICRISSNVFLNFVIPILRLSPDFLFMPLPILPGPVILHLCMLLNPPDAQVLAFWQVVFQAAAGAQDPSP